MVDIIVDTYKLHQYAERIAAVNSRINRLDHRMDSLYTSVGLQELWDLIQADALTAYSWRLVRCQSYLRQTALDFEKTENLILEEDPINFEGISIRDIINAYGTNAFGAVDGSDLKENLENLISSSAPYVSTNVLNMVLPFTSALYLMSGVAYGNGSSLSDYLSESYVNTNVDWLGYEISDDSFGITAWLGKANFEADNEWGHADVNAYIGKAKSALEADFAFMEVKREKEYIDGKWVEKTVTKVIDVEANAGASVSALAVDVEADVGTDMLGAEIEAEGSLGNAKVGASGEFSITDEGVNANIGGEAMVSAAEGEIEGTINILGFDITGKVGGYAGAAGVEGKVGIEDSKFVMEGGVAAILGVSGGIEIGFNDEGWNNFTDGVDEFVDYITFWD